MSIRGKVPLPAKPSYPVLALATFVFVFTLSHSIQAEEGEDWRESINRFINDYVPATPRAEQSADDIAFEVEMTPFAVEIPEHDTQAARELAGDSWAFLSEQARVRRAMEHYLSRLDSSLLNRWTLPGGMSREARALQAALQERDERLRQQSAAVTDALEHLRPSVAREMRRELRDHSTEKSFGGGGWLMPRD